MRDKRSAVVSNGLLWFGVGGGGMAWVAQFFAGLYFTWAQCNQPDGRTNLPVREWQAALGGAGAVVGLAALAVCLVVYFRTHNIGDVAGEERRGDGHAPPLGRVHFLAVVGLLINTLAIILCLLAAFSAPSLALCQQA